MVVNYQLHVIRAAKRTVCSILWSTFIHRSCLLTMYFVFPSSIINTTTYSLLISVLGKQICAAADFQQGWNKRFGFNATLLALCKIAPSNNSIITVFKLVISGIYCFHNMTTSFVYALLTKLNIRFVFFPSKKYLNKQNSWRKIWAVDKVHCS